MSLAFKTSNGSVFPIIDLDPEEFDRVVRAAKYNQKLYGHPHYRRGNTGRTFYPEPHADLEIFEIKR